MPVLIVLQQQPVKVEKLLSLGHGENYSERYQDNWEQGELVDNRIYVGGLGVQD